jgi:hypothetical protein
MKMSARPFLIALAFSSATQAQEAPVRETSTAPTTEPAVVTPEPAAPTEPAVPVAAPAPVPPAPVVVHTPHTPSFTVYGIIKPTIIVGNGSESFGQQTSVATTGAAHPVVQATPDEIRTTFQLQQTRLGLRAENGTIGGKLEVDFVHFEQSSPVQQAFPRLRIAEAYWTAFEGAKLVIGQGWDVWSPLNPHTFNLVGSHFLAGNSAFLRNQIAWYQTIGAIEIVGAAGMAFSNAGPVANNLEYALLPTGAARLVYKADKTAVGLSGIVGRLRFQDAEGEDVYHTAWGGSLHADVSFGPVNVKAEGYGGSNLANLANLTLGVGRADADQFEAGGWISAKYDINQHLNVFCSFGGAAILNTEDQAIGYVPGDTTTGVVATRVGFAGIENNVNLRAGVSVSPVKGLAFIAEPYFISTKHKLAPADSSVNGQTTAAGFETGARFDF